MDNSGWASQGDVPYFFGIDAAGNGCCIGKIVGTARKSDERPFRRSRKRHKVEVEEGTVMVRRLDHGALLPVMTGVYGILVVGKQVHEVLGRTTEQQQQRQPQRANDMDDLFQDKAKIIGN